MSIRYQILSFPTTIPPPPTTHNDCNRVIWSHSVKENRQNIIMQNISVSYSGDTVEVRIIEHDGDAKSPLQPSVQIVYKNTEFPAKYISKKRKERGKKLTNCQGENLYLTL